MPTRANRPCSKAGCPALAEQGKVYCINHRDVVKQYDKARNQSPLRQMYKTAAWRFTRQRVLARDPICKMCERALSTVVHHVVDASRYIGSFFDESNLQGLCKPCHDRRTAEDHLAGSH
jgi:5-methylcytosine-specific restriction enzyme A